MKQIVGVIRGLSGYGLLLMKKKTPDAVDIKILNF